jgi:hypothetical protein
MTSRELCNLDVKLDLVCRYCDNKFQVSRHDYIDWANDDRKQIPCPKCHWFTMWNLTTKSVDLIKQVYHDIPEFMRIVGDLLNRAENTTENLQRRYQRSITLFDYVRNRKVYCRLLGAKFYNTVLNRVESFHRFETDDMSECDKLNLQMYNRYSHMLSGWK